VCAKCHQILNTNWFFLWCTQQNGQTYIIVQNLNQLTYPVSTGGASAVSTTVSSFGVAPTFNTTGQTPVLIIKPSTTAEQRQSADSFNGSSSGGASILQKDIVLRTGGVPQATIVFHQNDLPMVASTQTVVTDDHVQCSGSGTAIGSVTLVEMSTARSTMTTAETEVVTSVQESLPAWPPCYLCPICSDKISGELYIFWREE